MRKILAIVFTCGALVAASIASAEDLTEESVQVAFENQNFINAFGQCFAGMDAPAEVTLVVIIYGNGGASLSGVEPMVLAQTKTCIEGSMAYLKFPATGGEYEITYPVPVPKVVGTPAPPPTVPTHPVVVATPPPTVVYAVDESQWRPLYNSGKRKMISGGVLMGLGGVLTISSLGVFALALTSSVLSDETSKTLSVTAAVLLIGGLACIITGGVTLGKGRRDKRKALMIRDGLAFNMPLIGFGPTPDGKGGMLAATWVF